LGRLNRFGTWTLLEPVESIWNLFCRWTLDGGRVMKELGVGTQIESTRDRRRPWRSKTPSSSARTPAVSDAREALVASLGRRSWCARTVATGSASRVGDGCVWGGGVLTDYWTSLDTCRVARGCARTPLITGLHPYVGDVSLAHSSISRILLGLKIEELPPFHLSLWPLFLFSRI
jgi:hypothetical protein